MAMLFLSLLIFLLLLFLLLSQILLFSLLLFLVPTFCPSWPCPCWVDPWAFYRFRLDHPGLRRTGTVPEGLCHPRDWATSGVCTPWEHPEVIPPRLVPIAVFRLTNVDFLILWSLAARCGVDSVGSG
jgi:hypothetical protein